MAKRIQRNLLQEDPELGQPIVEKACMNHLRGIMADGGVGYLLNDSLAFVPHRQNLSQLPVKLPLTEIEDVSMCKILGIFDTGMKIRLKSGKVEKFVVGKGSKLCDKLLNCLHKSPA